MAKTRYRIFCDGAVNLKPQRRVGEAGIGAVLYQGNTLLCKYGRPIGIRSSIQAELEGIILAINMAFFGEYDDPIIFTDSQQALDLLKLPINNLSGAVKPLVLTIHNLREQFFFDLQKVPRKEVHEADALAHLALTLLNSAQKDIK